MIDIKSWSGWIITLAVVLYGSVYCKLQAEDTAIERAVADAVELSRYSLPEDVELPQLARLTPEQVQLAAVPVMAGRSAYGYYDHEQDIIFVGPFEDMDEVEIHAFLVHESVHWLQHQHGRGFTNCRELVLLEAEAFHVQNRYLKSKGRPAEDWSARRYPCP